MRNPQVDPQRQRPLTAALALLLGGCAAMQPHAGATSAPAPQAAAVKCVEPAQIPVEPPMVGGKFNGDAKHDLQILAPNARALRDWGHQMHALLEACAGVAPGPASVPPKP